VCLTKLQVLVQLGCSAEKRLSWSWGQKKELSKLGWTVESLCLAWSY
jgi:hypothetical protein